VGIGLLLPDVLGTYSDTGNATVLARRLHWRDVDAEIVPVMARDVPPNSCDLYLIGGGEDTALYFAARWLARHPGLQLAMTNAVTFGVCAGLQLLGRVMVDRAGREHPGVGLLDLETHHASTRAIGEVVAWCGLPDVGRLTGFVNHGGATTLGPGVAPLAEVQRGPANTPDDHVEGAVSPAARRPGADGHRPGILATYLHGPVLARNPALADHLLSRVVGGPLPELDPGLLPDLPALRSMYLHRA
jgi:CobQ-like glutamine amidotransferase family enzyme